MYMVKFRLGSRTKEAYLDSYQFDEFMEALSKFGWEIVAVSVI